MKAKPEILTPLAFIEKTLEDYASFDSSIKVINSKMDQEMLEIRKKYSAELTECQQLKDASFNQLEAFALENQTVLFSLKRSFATKFGNFGFRTGKPKFQLSFPDNSWAAVTKMLMEYLPQYIKTVHEPAKEKLMADRYLPETNKYFPALGLSVVQDETFFVDLKK